MLPSPGEGMATNAHSIDAAARGYVRHRFVRALCTSVVVATVFGILAVVVAATGVGLGSGRPDQIVVLPLGIVLAGLLFLLPVVLAVAVLGAIVDLLHRRLVAFALMGLAMFCIYYLGLAGLGAGLTLLGVDILSSGSEPMTTQQIVTLFVSCTVGALIFYEVLREAWWQLTVAAGDFRAVRGWRPSPWRLITTFRRYLGLPSFLSYVGRRRLVATLLYFGVAVLNVGLVMMMLIPILLSSPGEQTEDFNPAIVIGSMAALLLLNLVGAGALLSRVADRRATRLYQNVREWDGRAPIVFLRAFDQDKARLRATGGDPFARWPAGVGRPRTLDEILLEHASPYGPVIAIGDPRDPTPPLGAARVFVSDEDAGWQDVVRGLAAASKAVVMCPNHGEGVQWELDLIAQAGGRLQTVFLASPELDRDATLALFKRFVPEMPEINPKQTPVAAYRCDGEWRVLTARRLSVESCTAALNTALQALFGMRGEPVKRAA
jgi:hypothetical protein